MDDRIMSLDRLREPGGISNIAFDKLEVGVIGEARAEVERVVDGDAVTVGQKLGREDMPHIPGATGNHNALEHWSVFPRRRLTPCDGARLTRRGSRSRLSARPSGTSA